MRAFFHLHPAYVAFDHFLETLIQASSDAVSRPAFSAGDATRIPPPSNLPQEDAISGVIVSIQISTSNSSIQRRILNSYHLFHRHMSYAHLTNSPALTVVLMQTGLGVYQNLVASLFPNPARRPHFIITSPQHTGWLKSLTTSSTPYPNRSTSPSFLIPAAAILKQSSVPEVYPH